MRRSRVNVVKSLLSVIVVSLCIIVSGCAAMSTAIKHRNLKVESKMSDTIFLDPVPSGSKNVYVQVKSTLSEDFGALKGILVQDLQSNGWTVVNDIDKAHDMIQVNVLQAGQAKNEGAVWGALSGGFGADIATGGLAGLAAAYATDSVGVGIGVGAAVSGISWVANQLVENVYYSMVTDVQVSVRVDGEVTQNVQANLSQGSQTEARQTYNQKTNWLRYRTRIVSMANQVNLKFNEAKPELQAQIAKQVSGILG